LNKKFKMRAWGERRDTLLNPTIKARSSNSQGEARAVLEQQPPFRRFKGGKPLYPPRSGSGEVLTKMSEKMFVQAIGEYISEASSAPEGGGVISENPLPPQSPNSQCKGRGRRGAAAEGSRREWNVKPVTCLPYSEETTQLEAPLHDVTTPEPRGGTPKADRVETPGQLPSEIVSQDSAQMTQLLKSV
jgi:hypothetical protein